MLLGNSAFFTSIGPMLYVFWLYATDRISDLDMSMREEREHVFVVFVIFFALGTIDLWLIGAPRDHHRLDGRLRGQLARRAVDHALLEDLDARARHHRAADRAVRDLRHRARCRFSS